MMKIDFFCYQSTILCWYWTKWRLWWWFWLWSKDVETFRISESNSIVQMKGNSRLERLCRYFAWENSHPASITAKYPNIQPNSDQLTFGGLSIFLDISNALQWAEDDTGVSKSQWFQSFKWIKCHLHVSTHIYIESRLMEYKTYIFWNFPQIQYQIKDRSKRAKVQFSLDIQQELLPDARDWSPALEEFMEVWNPQIKV